MTVTRADSFTETTKKVEFFSDFVDSFAKSPFGNQLGRVSNEKAVNQSLKNLILTNVGERPFQPFIGSDLLAMLFENNDDETLSSFELYIQNCVENNEPRVNLLSVQVVVSPYNENEIQINIIYNLINNPNQIDFSFLLKRVR
jgi:phage baseplate assembly protein W